jgi:hypothetical protein
MIPSGLA